MKPLVSVLIDTYNHERFIEEAILSVLEQDCPASEVEIIVVDDGSTDHTSEIVQKFLPDIRLIRKKNGGQASAFNVGIPQARGEFVAFLDGDDWWARDKLTAIVEAFRRNPGVGTVGHGIVEVDLETRSSKLLSPGEVGYFDLASSSGAQTFRNFMAFLGTSRVSIRKDVLATVLPIPLALVVEADEFMSALSVARRGGVILAGPFTYYRLHRENLYQFRQGDPDRIRRKIAVSLCLAEQLPTRLREHSVPDSSINLIVEPIQVMASRMRLSLEGGSRFQTYRVERAAFRLSYRKTGFAYRIYKEASLLLTLLLSPRFYYKIQSLYAGSAIRKIRALLGEPVPIADIREESLPAGPSGMKPVKPI
jgi:glycosyltransferase involved in cell wall biosynthesis